jgi:hypothetical protein
MRHKKTSSWLLHKQNLLLEKKEKSQLDLQIIPSTHMISSTLNA